MSLASAAVGRLRRLSLNVCQKNACANSRRFMYRAKTCSCSSRVAPHFERLQKRWHFSCTIPAGDVSPEPQDCEAFAPTYEALQVLTAEGSDIQTEAWSTPSLVDWNVDGLPDLLVGEKVGETGKIRVFLNSGTNEAPAFAESFYVQAEGQDLVLPAAGCLGVFPRMVDWNADDLPDLLVGLADGTLQVFHNTGTAGDPVFFSGQVLQAGEPGAQEDIHVGMRATFDVADVNSDGLQDLVVGALDGHIRFYHNQGSAEIPSLASAVFAQGVEGNLVVPSLRSSPVVRDFNDDGLLDLMSGNTEGQIYFYENVGTAETPAFSEGILVQAGGETIDLADTPRSRPFVGDLNGDGRDDLLVGAADGLVRLYQAEPLVTGLEIGQRAPDRTFTDLQGNEVSVSDYRGRDLLLIFGSTWCSYTQAKIPLFQSLHSAYGGTDLDILFVYVGQDDVTARDHVETEGITYDVVVDPEGRSVGRYMISGIPHGIYLDPEGVIQYSGSIEGEIIEQLVETGEPYAPAVEEFGPVAGVEAPNFTLTDLNGETVTLDTMRGREVLLVFGTSWCGYTQQAIPFFQRMHEEYGSDDFEVVFVYVGEDAATAADNAVLNGATYTVLADPARTASDLYRISPVPWTFYIDAEGVIKYAGSANQPVLEALAGHTDYDPSGTQTVVWPFVDDLAPDFTLLDSQGEDVSLSEYRGTNTYLVLTETDCASCQAELPNLAELHERFGGDGMEVVLVVQGADTEQLVRFVATNDIPYTVLADPDDTLHATYGTSADPRAFFIDPEGRISYIGGISVPVAEYILANPGPFVHAPGGPGVGEAAPDFALMDTTNVEVTLSDYQGKNVLLVFGSAGSPRMENKVPLLNLLKSQYPDLEVIFISKGGTPEHLAQYAIEVEAFYTLVADTTLAAVQAYGIRYAPWAFLVDPEGVIQYSGLINPTPIQQLLTDGTLASQYVQVGYTMASLSTFGGETCPTECQVWQEYDEDAKRLVLRFGTGGEICYESCYKPETWNSNLKEYANGIDDDGDGLIDEYHDTENYGAMMYDTTRSWWDQKNCNGIGMCVQGQVYANRVMHWDMGNWVPNPYYRADVEEDLITCWTNRDGAFPNATTVDKCGVDKDYDCGGVCDGGENDGEDCSLKAMCYSQYTDGSGPGLRHGYNCWKYEQYDNSFCCRDTKENCAKLEYYCVPEPQCPGGECMRNGEDHFYINPGETFADRRFFAESCDGIGECGESQVWCIDNDIWNPVDCMSNPGRAEDDSSPEVCDGLDNDCDGVNDDGVNTPMSAGIDLLPVDDLGPSDTDNITNVTQPLIVGTAEPGATVRLYDGEIEVGTGVSDETGAFEILPVVPLPDGAREFQVRAAIYECGESLSDPLPFVIDTQLPTSSHSIEQSQVILTASDSGAGIHQILYRINFGDWLVYSTPIAAVALDRIEYYAVDLAGNIESVVHDIRVPLRGDMDNDGRVIDLDIDLLYGNLADVAPDSRFDLDGDGDADQADVDILVGELVETTIGTGTAYADFDLDGKVGLLDLAILGDNYKTQGGWASGDADGDGVVGILDLGMLGDNYGFQASTEPLGGALSLSSTADHEVFPRQPEGGDLTVARSSLPAESVGTEALALQGISPLWQVSADLAVWTPMGPVFGDTLASDAPVDTEGIIDGPVLGSSVQLGSYGDLFEETDDMASDQVARAAGAMADLIEEATIGSRVGVVLDDALADSDPLSDL